MNFVSWSFLLLFVPVFLFRLTVGRRKLGRASLVVIAVASTVFVAWHIPEYLLVMLVSIVVDYFAAARIARLPAGSRGRYWLLVASLATNLLLLAVFKYTGFFIGLAERASRLAGWGLSFPEIAIELPLGISFYTFCSMSYTIDVYRREIAPAKRFFDFYYFVTFFPHLVAGPIVRAKQFLHQMPRPRRMNLRVFEEGAFLICRGLFLKMVCADGIGNATMRYWTASSPGNSVDTVLLIVLFAAQIYCDFEGYTGIARGLSYWLGFRFPINFDAPYLAGSFRNFWERWHITLSRWLRDYLYVPLGGNRLSSLLTYRNLLLVMLLGGLWHGARINFILWGAIHGVGLAVERLFGFDKRLESAGARFAWFVVVQGTVLFAWVFFRAPTLHDATSLLARLVYFRWEAPMAELVAALKFLLPVVAIHAYAWFRERQFVPVLPPMARAVLAGPMSYGAMVMYAPSQTFIYFQF